MFAGRGKGREEEMVAAGERGHLAGAPFKGTQSMSRWTTGFGKEGKERKERRRWGKKWSNHIQGPLEGSMPIGRFL